MGRVKIPVAAFATLLEGFERMRWHPCLFAVVALVKAKGLWGLLELLGNHPFSLYALEGDNVGGFELFLESKVAEQGDEVGLHWASRFLNGKLGQYLLFV